MSWTLHNVYVKRTPSGPSVNPYVQFVSNIPCRLCSAFFCAALNALHVLHSAASHPAMLPPSLAPRFPCRCFLLPLPLPIRRLASVPPRQSVRLLGLPPYQQSYMRTRMTCRFQLPGLAFLCTHARQRGPKQGYTLSLGHRRQTIILCISTIAVSIKSSCVIRVSDANAETLPDTFVQAKSLHNCSAQLSRGAEEQYLFVSFSWLPLSRFCREFACSVVSLLW